MADGLRNIALDIKENNKCEQVNLLNGKKKNRSPKYMERMKERVDAGLSLAPSDGDNGSIPRPATVVKIIEIAKKIVKGKTRIDCIDYIMNTYDISEKTAVKYYDAALAYLIPTDIENFKDKLIAQNMARYEQLYNDAYQARQYKVAKDILDSINKMYGVMGNNRVQIAESAEGDKIINISFD